MAKDISKSIRLSQEDFDFIDSYDGDSFSEKLDNMIAVMHVEIPRKIEYLRCIDNTIKMKREEFQRLSRYMSDLDVLVMRAKRVTGELSSIEQLIDLKFKGVLDQCEKSDV